MSDSYHPHTNTNTNSNSNSHPERLAGGAPTAVATAQPQQGPHSAWSAHMLGSNSKDNSGAAASSGARAPYGNTNSNTNSNGAHYATPPPLLSVVPPPGLLNIGETCYLNSVVQVLYHTPAFRRAILDYEEEEEQVSNRAYDDMKNNNNNSNNSDVDIDDDKARVARNARDVAVELKSLFTTIQDTHDNIDPSSSYRRDWVQPNNLVDMLRDKRRDFEFVADGQQDAHEFLRFLLENVSTAFDLNIRAKKNKYRSLHKRSAEDTTNTTTTTTGSSESSPRPRKRPRSSAALNSNSNSNSTAGTSKVFKNRFAIRSEEIVLDGSAESPPKHTALKKNGNGNGNTSSGSERRADLLTSDANLVRKIFRGESVTSTRCCECETASTRPEAFLDLSIPVPANGSGKSMAGLLTHMAAGDMLNGNNKYACETCHTKTEAERRFYLSYLPEVVTIHLKLFQYCTDEITGGVTMGKIGVATPAPFRMKFDEWCNGNSNNNGNKDTYALTGIIVHTGGCSTSGHYYSFVYSKEMDTWFKCDDSKVTNVAEEDIEMELFYGSGRSRETGYLLFYTRENDDDK